MKKNSTVTLKMSPVGPFFSEKDEELFFEWLDKIKCVKKYEGHFCTLDIEVDADLIDENELREMIALFLRYDVDMKQLAMFDHPQFSVWLKNKSTHWYGVIFGDKSTIESKREAREESIEFMRELTKNRDSEE